MTITPNVFTEGHLVLHQVHPEWGLGRILATDGAKVHVFFAEQSGNVALLIQTKADGKPLELAPEQAVPWLDGLPAFSMKGGRMQLPNARLTKKQALAVFLQRYPLGFNDTHYLADERDYKWEAAYSGRTWAPIPVGSGH